MAALVNRYASGVRADECWTHDHTHAVGVKHLLAERARSDVAAVSATRLTFSINKPDGSINKPDGVIPGRHEMA